MKKWFALILAAVMIIGCLAGCSGKEPEATEPESTPVQMETTVPVTEPEITEPEATEPVVEIITHGKMIRNLYKLANPSGDYEDLEGAIAWAVKNGVVTDDAPFDPEAALTHLDLARFLYRYAKALDVVRDSDKLEDLKGWVWDESEITEEADREAVAWAIGSGVMVLHQRQLLPDEAVTASEYRVIPARLSSLVKEVKAEQKATVEATEPEEIEPEEAEESGSESESGSSGSSGNSGSGNSGSSGGSSSGSSGGSSSGSGSSGNSGGSGSGDIQIPVEDPPAVEYPAYDKDAAMAAGNNYLSSLGCVVTSDVMWEAYNFPIQCTRRGLYENSGQDTLNQFAINHAADTINDVIASSNGQTGGDLLTSQIRAYCYITDYTDPGGNVGYLIYVFYG